jgi:hypothetical protein
VNAPTIKSQPVYAPLRWDHAAASHLLAAQGGGCGRILELLAAAPTAPFKILAVAPAGSDLAADLAKAAGASGLIFDSEEALFPALRAELGAGRMGLRLYLAGTEGFVWKAAREARGFGMSADEIQAEQAGSQERRVYCTHCRHVSEGVRTNLHPCPGCKRVLFVRDHFSRHLAAYMGFQVDAEVPGVFPPVEEAYP